MSDQDDVQESPLEERLKSLTPEERVRLRDALRERGRPPTAISRRTETGPAPLSFSQQSLWFLDRLQPGAPTNHGARVTHLSGELDTAALREALTAIVERHESLRTVFLDQGREPVQVALEDWQLPLPVVDLQHLTSEERGPELSRRLREESRKPFDLASDLMVRLVLFRLGPSEHVLLLVIHHVAVDGWSERVLNRELSELYDAHRAGRKPTLAELPMQYADFAVWQRARLQGKVLDDLLSFWHAELEDAPVRLRLPTDRARPPIQRHVGRHYELSFDGELGKALALVARKEGATVYMGLLAVFGILLYRFSGQDDFLVGTPVANRTHVSLENLIGFFSNTLVVRNRLGGNPSFRELLRRVRQTTVGAFEHQELPFEKLVQSLRVERNPAYNPLFQVNFRAGAGARDVLELAGLTSTPLSIDLGFSRFDLALELQLGEDAVSGYFEYDEDLFAESTIESLASGLESLLGAIAKDPDRSILALAPAARDRRAPVPRGIGRLRDDTGTSS